MNGETHTSTTQESFFTSIARQFGQQTSKNLKDLSNNRLKMIKISNRKLFLLKCRTNGVIPDFISNNLIDTSNFFTSSISASCILLNLKNRYSRKLLNIAIKDTHNIQNCIANRIAQLNDEILFTLPPHIFDKFYTFENKKYTKLFKIHKNKCIRKFNNFLAAKNNSFNNNFNGFNSFNNLASNFDNNNWLKNLCDVEIPVNVKKVLVLGPKHALCAPRNFITSPKFIASVESGLMKINDENTQTTTRIRMVNKILNFTTNQSKINNPLLSKSEIIETKKFFQENNNLLVLKSDKGNTTVLVSKDFYNMEVMKMLNDETTYTVSRFEYTCTFERRSNSIVSNMVKKQQISEQMGKLLKTYNSIVPRAYALPKTHKETLSWRIIVSSIDGPTYKLSGFLANILSKIVGKSPYHTVDSWQFCKEIRNIHLPDESLRLVSLDVVSLFTNVPVDLAIQVLHHRWTEIEQHTKIDRDGFLQAVKFVLESNIF